MPTIESFLTEHTIAYEKCEHEAVFTCDESSVKVPPLPGVHTKNLFLQDEKGTRYILVVVECEKRVDLKALKGVLEAKGLTFAPADKMMELLGVEPGSVTILGLMTDTNHVLEVIIDEDVWKADAIQCHPMVNTATLVISHVNLEKFLAATGHTARVLSVPTRTA